MPSRNLQEYEYLIKKNNIELIDLKCIDLTGRLHHISLPVYAGILQKIIKQGVGFDGSSYGFIKVESSDIILVPDLGTAVIDPFRETPTLSFYSYIVLANGKQTPYPQDSRLLAKSRICS